LIVAEESFVLVEAALVDGAACKALAASLTVKGQSTGVELPEDCVPIDLFAPKIQYKFIKVPNTVYFVLLPGLPLGIYIQSGVLAMLPSELVFSEELAAQHASFKSIAPVLKHDFKAFHVELASQFVFAICYIFKYFKIHNRR